MREQAPAKANLAVSAIFFIAFVAAVLVGTSVQRSLAQIAPGTAKALTPVDRNLQVQVTTPAKLGNAQRVALVIGNSAYKEAPLANPVNDARSIVKALQESGFNVILRENVDQRGMLSALREFGDNLRGGGTGLFYYAGHGMQIKGRNYLIPVGAHIEREDEVAYSAVDAQAVLDKMEAAGNVANIMILDACRNNPFTRSTRSAQAGLAQMDAPVGTLVAYATSPGAVASDGGGSNGLYTQHLLTAIRQPGSKVEDVFKQVRANVRRDSQGKQVPWESTSLEGDFYFKAAPVALVLVAPTPADSGAAREAALWDAVKASTLPVEINVYLKRYPKGQFVAQANARLAQLQAMSGAATVSAPTMPTMPAPVSAAVQSSPNPPGNTDFQAEVDRRTEEILASLANSAVQSDKPTKLAAPRPLTSGNKTGFSAGDRWRYQVVDKFKGEVVRNRAEIIDLVQPDGTLIANKGDVRKDATGNLRYIKGADRTRTYSSAYVNIPPVLQSGAKTDLKYEVDVQFTDGRSAKEVGKGSMTVKGQEVVKTPAGDFTAWRVEIDVLGWTKDTAGSYRRLFTGWYVPELRNYVAFDDESRSSKGSINHRERHELTSFSVRGAETLATR